MMIYIPFIDNNNGKSKIIKYAIIDNLIGLIVKLSAGYFDTQKHRLVRFLEPIENGAQAILSETVRGLVVARVIQISKNKLYNGTILYHITGLRKVHEIISDLTKNTLSDRLSLSAQLSDNNEESIKQVNSGKYAETKIIKNHKKITSLLHRLDKEPENKLTIIRELSDIAKGNDTVIIRLIQEYFLAEEETKEAIYFDGITKDIFKVLSEIAVGNETGINRLIQILDESLDESKIVNLIFDKTSKINTGTINLSTNPFLPDPNFYSRLVDCLKKNKSTSNYVDYSLSKIRFQDGGAVLQLIQIMEKKSNKSIQKMAVDILGEIKVENTRIMVIKLLGKIAIGNERAISRLIQLLDEVKFSRDRISREVADNLGEMAVGNEKAILRLIQLLDEDTFTRKSVVQSLGKIAAGNQIAINRLIKLLDEAKISQYSTTTVSQYPTVVESLGKIAIGNQMVINRLIQMLDEISYPRFQIPIAENLMKIRTRTNKLSYSKIVLYFKNNLLNPIQYDNFNYYQQSYKLLWQCAQNVNYPEFYEAWHSKVDFYYRNRPIPKKLLALITQCFLIVFYLAKKIILFAALVMMIAILFIMMVILGILRIFVIFVKGGY